MERECVLIIKDGMVSYGGLHVCVALVRKRFGIGEPPRRQNFLSTAENINDQVGVGGAHLLKDFYTESVHGSADGQKEENQRDTGLGEHSMVETKSEQEEGEQPTIPTRQQLETSASAYMSVELSPTSVGPDEVVKKSATARSASKSQQQSFHKRMSMAEERRSSIRSSLITRKAVDRRVRAPTVQQEISVVRKYMRTIMQQKLPFNKRCFLAFKIRYAVLGLVAIAIVFIALGVTITVLTYQTVAVEVEYESGDTQKTLEIPSNMQPPVYVYYRLDNFYGNQRRYASDGPNYVYGDLHCKEVKTREEGLQVRLIDGQQTLPALEATTEQTGLYPCGLSSVGLFNDVFSIWKDNSSFPIDRHTAVNHADFPAFMNDEASWGSTEPWIFTSDAGYRTWLHEPFTPSFLRQYGVIFQGLAEGTYQLRLDTNLWPAKAWGARKHVYLIELSPMGGRNTVLGYLALAAGFVLLVSAVALLMLVKVFKLRLASQSMRHVDLSSLKRAAADYESRERRPSLIARREAAMHHRKPTSEASPLIVPASAPRVIRNIPSFAASAPCAFPCACGRHGANPISTIDVSPPPAMDVSPPSHRRPSIDGRRKAAAPPSNRLGSLDEASEPISTPPPERDF
eukprot:GHVS01021656.1.p1 GENE.GHVS01021656.1~~GHVS01021656.1.p1  ORF type:complete len:627 (+),score=76.07 GHVS01021656.1:250-2130(+)